MSRLLSPTIWLPFNLVGIGCFLLAASKFWIEPEVADIPGASAGNAFGWIVNAFPIAAFFVLANFVWLAASLLNLRGHPLARTALVGAILLCWLGAYLFDNAHHGI